MDLNPLAFVALGSNLGDSRQILLQAMKRLEDLTRQPLLKSSLWQTSPVRCPPGSPRFVNAVAGLVPCPAESAESLFRHLQALEKEFGRRPKQVLNEPRSLDLDLISFGALVCATQDLVLPHPRAHQRRFVLQPLSEIAPDYRLPGQTQTVAQLLADLPSDEVVRQIL